MKKNFLSKFAWATIFCLILTSNPMAAQSLKDNPKNASSNTEKVQRIILVLDASGSMWARVNGKAKIEIAKEVLIDLIKELPDQSKVGLVAYGHRSKGDCQDVEELVPLHTVDKKLLISKIKAINPKGKTPITRSIRMTAQKLKDLKKETSIILVSDGKETCEGDPCALVKELKAADIRFTMYVIGFDVTKVEKDQLECIANAGGGQYFTAKTAQEFRLAATQAIKESQNFGYLKVTAQRNNKPIAALMDIFEQGKKKVLFSVHTITDATLPGTKLKPGIYDLKITDKKQQPPQSVSISGVAVTAGITTEKSADFSGGGLSVKVLANNKNETASLYVYPAGKDNPLVTGDTSAENPKLFILGSGHYDLRVVYKKSNPETIRWFKDIEIKTGQTIEKQIEFGQGHLSVKTLVNDRKDSASLYIFETGTQNRVATGDTSRDNPKIFAMIPGRYDLEIIYRKSKPETIRWFKGIEIKAGQTIEKKAEFGQGQLSVKVLVNDSKGSAGLYVFDAGTKKRVCTGDTSSKNPRVFKLNAGNYDLKVVYRKAEPEKEINLENIQVVQAKTVEKQIEFQEGILEINVTSGGKSTRGGLTFFRPKEKKRFATGNAGKSTRMQPGNYEVAVKAYKLKNKPEKRIPFTIQKGQTTILNVDF